MKLRNQDLKYNLQFFAENSEDGDNNDNVGDDGDGDQSEQSEETEKTFTQAELDEAIKKRLERERKKAEKKQSATNDKSEDKPADNKADENTEKLTALEMKVLCYDHDIAKEYSKDAIALAKAYVDEDTDMDEALEKVIKKFPQFVKGTKTSNNKDDDTESKGSWGARQKEHKQKALEDMSYEEYKAFRQGK